MSIRSKLLLMLAIPLAALALVGALGFRAQSSNAQLASDSLDDDTVVQSLNTSIKAIGAERLTFAQDVSNRAEQRFATDESLLQITELAQNNDNRAVVQEAVRDVTRLLTTGRNSRSFETTIANYNEATEILRETRVEVDVVYPNQESFANAGSADFAVDIADRQDAIWFEYISAEEITPELIEDLRNEAVVTEVFRQEIIDLVPDTHLVPINTTLAGDSDALIQEATGDALDRFQTGRAALDRDTVVDFVAESHNEWFEHAVTLQADVQSNLGSLSDTAQGRQNLFALLGSLGLLILLGLIYVVYHSVVTPLNNLLEGAESVANDRLPSAVAELRTMGSSDATVRLEPLTRTGDDELGTLVDAFNDVQLTAFDLAVEQARSRRNIAEMFVNLGRRNQKLLQRMLGVISGLEHGEKNADKLEQLFELDHMATRMRRNAESLLVVAGTTTPRQWSKPVPAADVVRSALAEVQDYHRVDVLALADAPMAGNAVADVTHLLAELLENSLQFSEPESRVSISSRWHETNYRIVVTDQGFGMTDEEMADYNALIANPPAPDEAPTRFLGLFVVGHLAQRHGITVQLTDATIGGTDARITIPVSVMSDSAPLDLGAGSDNLPTRDGDELETHLDLDAELAALTAESDSLLDGESTTAPAQVDDDVFAAPMAEAPAAEAPAAEEPLPEPAPTATLDVETFSGAADELPVRGDINVFSEPVAEAAVPPQSETFATNAAAVAETNTFTTATSELPVRGEANIDFGELPQLEKLPPRPPSSIGDLPSSTEAPAPVAAPQDVAAMGLPQRTPRATMQTIDSPVAAVAAPAAVVEATGPEDLTSAAANVGSMFSAFQAGVQRGEQKTD